jgi:hypothetical protein
MPQTASLCASIRALPPGVSGRLPEL